jgi:hypothetical protein
MAHCNVALVVVPYDTLPGERHWLWYCITHYHVKALVMVPVDIMSYGITTRVFHLAMCDAVPQPMYFTWQCAMRYHNQCISGNASHIARWNTLVVIPYDIMSTEIHWLWYRIAHCQLKYTGNGTAYHIARWNTLIARYVPFIWQCVIRYHDQCLSPGNVSYGTITSALTWQCVIQYHNQCLSPGNVSYTIQILLIKVSFHITQSC